MTDLDLEEPQFFQFLLEWLENLPYGTGDFLHFLRQSLVLGLQLVYL